MNEQMNEEEPWTDKMNRADKRAIRRRVRKAMQRVRPRLTHWVQVESAVNRQLRKVKQDAKRAARRRDQEDRSPEHE